MIVGTEYQKTYIYHDEALLTNHAVSRAGEVAKRGSRTWGAGGGGGGLYTHSHIHPTTPNFFNFFFLNPVHTLSARKHTH